MKKIVGKARMRKGNKVEGVNIDDTKQDKEDTGTKMKMLKSKMRNTKFCLTSACPSLWMQKLDYR